MPSHSKFHHALLGVISPTIEAVTLNAISGMLAQAFTSYQAKSISAVDITHILQFMFFTAITAAPNDIFQTSLEQSFPTRTVPKSWVEQLGRKDKSKEVEVLRKYGRPDTRNTFVKFVLDQSLSATTNTVLFIVALGLIKGQSIDNIQSSLSEDFWPMLVAGYRFWPMACLVNLVMVPMEYRALVGNGAGLVWGVYMSLW